MNIFALDYDPIRAAEYQCDQHVVKMTLESAQLLCSQYTQAPYKRSFYNHPCSKWTRHNLANFLWLCKHALALSKEYEKRYHKVHKSLSAIKWCIINYKQLNLPILPLTPFVLAMPDDCKTSDPVDSYRSYYLKYKLKFARYNHGPKPYWL